MLFVLRRLTRPFSLALLAVMLVPAALDCCELLEAHAQGMACCRKSIATEGTLNGDCCGVEQASNSQQPASAAEFRVVQSSLTAAPLATASLATVPDVVSAAIPSVICPAGNQLYLRLSTLRR